MARRSARAVSTPLFTSSSSTPPAPGIPIPAPPAPRRPPPDPPRRQRLDALRPDHLLLKCRCCPSYRSPAPPKPWTSSSPNPGSAANVVDALRPFAPLHLHPHRLRPDCRLVLRGGGGSGVAWISHGGSCIPSMNSGEGYVSLEETYEYNGVVNQTFKSDKQFYAFYNSYARSKGFSIRKQGVRHDKCTRRVIWRKFCCSFEGYRRAKYFGRSDRKRKGRALTRCGCKAMLEIQLCEQSGIWYVKKFVAGHNHRFSNPEHTYLLRSHRGLNDAQQCEAIELGLGGLRTCEIMDVMERNHGGPDDTGFIRQDLYNFFARLKKERVKGKDAEYVLNYLRSKKEEDSEFFFKHSVDAQGHLQNLFWSDSRSRLDYNAFGDVVVFDSTYRVNRYNLPFVPFVGVDHHRSTVIFGCGIISDETVASYVWLLEAFLEAMGLRHPDSLITDGDLAMAKAIERVMPGADHRLCSWHIEQRMVMHLRRDKLKEFRKFIYHPMEINEFERRWVQFLETHEIKDDDQWFWKMYDLRFKWSAAYTKDKKFLGMRSNQRSESLNSRLHNHLDRRMYLIDLVQHYDFCLLRIRRTQIELNGKALVGVPFHEIYGDPFMQKAARIYTPKIFDKVKVQIEKLSQWEVNEVSCGENDSMRFEVASQGRGERLFHVSCSYNGSTLVNASCRCRMLVCEGIPCAHIFAVLRSLGIQMIPPCCVMFRWTMQANNAFPVDRVTNTYVWSEQMERFRGLRNKGHRALFKASRFAEETERVMEFFDAILGRDENEESTEGASIGPLPANFSGAQRRSNGIGVLNPKKKISKGAPPTNKRLRSWRERNWRK